MDFEPVWECASGMQLADQAVGVGVCSWKHRGAVAGFLIENMGGDLETIVRKPEAPAAAELQYFACVYLGDRARLRILAYHALRAGHRLFGIPDFRYYALADGIKRLLEALRRPFIARLVSERPLLQPNLFDP